MMRRKNSLNNKPEYERGLNVMGWEKYIILNDMHYEEAVDEIYKSFQTFAPPYTIVKDDIGFTLNGDDPKWPELMEISVTIAYRINYAVPDGNKFIYCLFHMGGYEASQWIETIENTLERMGKQYIMDDL